ncbi:MAG: PRTRC system ParB family protein, partial [Gammaproteobacteria bacterium]|nr:PRTRC system ParB family protein [Gammaproteobacteria bacterium]
MPDTFRYIKARSIKPGQNPRTYFDQKEHDEMVESIKAQGVIQPINVRPSDDAYEIIAGERRWRAALEISNDFEIPCMIRTVTDDVALTMAVIENKDRSHMSATEEAAGAEKLLQTYKGDREEVARVLGWSRSTLDKRLALMHCTPEVRKALDERSILLGHAELLAAVPHDKQNTSLATIIGQKLDVNTVRKALAQKANKIDSACFDRELCLACQYNSAQQRALFDAVIDDGYCTNPACYEQKTTAHLDALKSKLSEDIPNVRVIQAGDENASVMLMVEGNLGVGEVQAAACRTCANFGCTISALPGHVGEVEREICFDPACNQKKVAARIKAEKEPNQATKQSGAEKKQTNAKNAGKGKSKADDDSKPTALRQGIMDYR